MNLATLLSQREDILHLAAQDEALNLPILGFVARRESTPGSDLDLFAELEPERPFLDQMALIQDLEDFLGCPVDVVKLDRSNSCPAGHALTGTGSKTAFYNETKPSTPKPLPHKLSLTFPPTSPDDFSRLIHPQTPKRRA